MITRTTLKALWVGGGGILATWLAVSPNHVPPSASQGNAVQQPPAIARPSAEELDAQAVRLRERTAEVTLRPSTRNPFRYNARKANEVRAREHRDEPAVVELAPQPPLPVVTLSGMAQTAGKRTAIITIDGQIYLVGDGDSFAGRYTVIAVDAETVLIRDAAGAEQRLVLP